MKKLLCFVLTACLLLTLGLPALAAGDSDDPNVYLCHSAYFDGDDFIDSDTVLTFDPATATLTIDDHDNSVPIHDEEGFYNWIRSIAPGVKTVLIKKDSTLQNFCLDEDGDSYSTPVFWKAFSYLEALERFEVETGNYEFTAPDGVLYTRRCFELVHYPAAKPDKTYQISDWCMYGVYPYAFCNTKYLERLELPYLSMGKVTVFAIGECAFSAMDLDTGAEKTGSIKEITFHGVPENLKYMGSVNPGNNVLEQAEIISLGTDFFHDLFTYIKIEYVMHFIWMFDMYTYLLR